jgi:hypothetical protein
VDTWFGLYVNESKGVFVVLIAGDRAEVVSRWAMTLAAVVTVDTLGQFPDQVLGAVQGLGIVIEAQLVFEGG